MRTWRVLRVSAALAVCTAVLFAALPQRSLPSFALARHDRLRTLMQRANVVPSWVVFLGTSDDPKPTLFCLQVDGFRGDTGLTRLYVMHEGCRPEPLRWINNVRDTFHYRTLLRWWHLGRADRRGLAQAFVERLARYYCEEDESHPEEVYLSALVERQSFTTGRITSDLVSIAAYDCMTRGSARQSRFSKLKRSPDGALELLP